MSRNIGILLSSSSIEYLNPKKNILTYIFGHLPIVVNIELYIFQLVCMHSIDFEHGFFGFKSEIVAPHKHKHKNISFIYFPSPLFAAAKRWRINSRHWMYEQALNVFLVCIPVCNSDTVDASWTRVACYLHSYKTIYYIKTARTSCTHLYYIIVRYGLPIEKEGKKHRTIHFSRSEYEAHTHIIQHKRNTWYISAMESHRFCRFHRFKVKVYAVRCVLALSGKTPKVTNRLQKWRS